ncbi:MULTISPECIES: hypothetical protein [unclassified Sphingomonas]|uniref:hypothetical protein n=1 Tax=Novosphingobium rhizosphaerae TaxID=1551649 RepID=UPI0017DF4095
MIYSIKPPEYAIYQTDTRVVVQYADDRALADRQRTSLIGLNPLRGEITGLTETWNRSKRGGFRAHAFSRRVANALALALEGDGVGAETELRAIRQEILDQRLAIGRFEYLVAAFGVGVITMTLIALATLVLDWGETGAELARASAAGAVGAFFSITLAIRGRTVLPDLQRLANVLDAALRMVIGLIAGGTLMALVAAHVVSVGFGDTALASKGTGDSSWLLPLIYGFVAGFSERFVPDLLAKASASTEAPRTVAAQPIAAAAPANNAKPLDGAGNAPGGDAEPDPDPAPEQASIDACLCDHPVGDDDATDDADLPAASGGVAQPAQVP